MNYICYQMMQKSNVNVLFEYITNKLNTKIFDEVDASVIKFNHNYYTIEIISIKYKVGE